MFLVSTNTEPLHLKVNPEATGVVEHHESETDVAFAQSAMEIVHSSINFISNVDTITNTYQNPNQRGALKSAAKELAAQNLGEALISMRSFGIKFEVKGQVKHRPGEGAKFNDLLGKRDHVIKQAKEAFQLLNNRPATPEELVQETIAELTDLYIEEGQSRPERPQKEVFKELGSTILYYMAPNK